MDYKDEYGKIFGRINEDGNVCMLYVENGDVVTTMDENVYPIDSDISARYEHPRGIVLTLDDAQSIGIEIENE